MSILVADSPRLLSMLIKNQDAQNYNIAILDDSRITRIILLNFVKKNGFQLKLCTGNPFELIDFVNMNKIDIAILDIALPDINGYEVAKLIKNKVNHILMCTALDANYISNNYANEPYKIIYKPISELELIKTLSELILQKDSN